MDQNSLPQHLNFQFLFFFKYSELETIKSNFSVIFENQSLFIKSKFFSIPNLIEFFFVISKTFYIYQLRHNKYFFYQFQEI